MKPIPPCDNATASDKLPVQEVPTELVLGAARALRDGNKTRAPLSWRNGPIASRYYGSLLRHLMAWWEGQEVDPKSGLNHLDHAAANLGVLMAIVEGSTHNDTDDRPRCLVYEESNSVSPGNAGVIGGVPVDKSGLAHPADVEMPVEYMSQGGRP